MPFTEPTNALYKRLKDEAFQERDAEDHDAVNAADEQSEIENSERHSICTPTKQPVMEQSGQSDQGIGPNDILLLKVIGRGTFAQQVALARHRHTQDIFVVKTLDKQHLVRRKQVRHTLTEKKVLQNLSGHPFIVKLYSAFQTECDVNFVLEYCQGGELFFHLQHHKAQKFEEATMAFYAAEVLSALKTLHEKGVVYRDLKPENVLLDAQGHIKLADFGFAKQEMMPKCKTFSFCGSPEYLSPEMVAKAGHGIETDMWSYGCFCYELLTGLPPFQDDNLSTLFQKITMGKVWYPPDLSEKASSLLRDLLCVDPSKRLTAADAMNHPFFSDLDWEKLQNRQVSPPIRPECHGCDCTRNFDDGFTTSPLKFIKPHPSSKSKTDITCGPDFGSCGSAEHPKKQKVDFHDAFAEF
uniref:Protein kinase putative n=1 Tax=Albugo laibachii Nc14 TaxID=890382 RepID=F0WM09_9STRA|nr:protein kinase putative [Albugo laibachii Nc14]|eukprot:CCA22336.1 protein kinase putative [Albugo laibachii Nc14]